MKTERFVILILSVTVVIQAFTMYKSTPVRPTSRQRAEATEQLGIGKSFSIAGMPILGDPKANAVIVEFSDYECPFCARHATSVLSEIRKKFVDPGQIRYAFANNPLSNHANAQILSLAAICAGQRAKYWEMHDALFRLKPRSEKEITEVAESIGLNSKALGLCIKDDATSVGRINDDVSIAQDLGLTGTPSFVIGRLGQDGQLKVVAMLRGAQPLAAFEKLLNEVVKS
jgi:protein-disulfide isomerase